MSFFRDDSPPVITGAQLSRQAELHNRTRRYAITMGIRSLSFVLAVALPLPVPAKILLIVAAITLPWVAVTAANAGPVKQKRGAGYDVDSRPVTKTEPLQLEGHKVIDAEPVDRAA